MGVQLTRRAAVSGRLQLCLPLLLVSVGGVLTGRGADVMILDDILKTRAVDFYSEKELPLLPSENSGTNAASLQ